MLGQLTEDAVPAKRLNVGSCPSANTYKIQTGSKCLHQSVMCVCGVFLSCYNMCCELPLVHTMCQQVQHTVSRMNSVLVSLGGDVDPTFGN